MYQPDIVVKDSLFDPDAAQPIPLWRDPKSDNPYYRVFLYLDGNGLPYINAVTYVLHPSFDNPTRQVVRTATILTASWNYGHGECFRFRQSLPTSRGPC
jgi:hypothetical protein